MHQSKIENQKHYDINRNPIYDSVFKYLMQDTRVAKVMIENLLGYKVGNVTIKNNENCVYKVVERIDEKVGRKYLQTKEYISTVDFAMVSNFINGKFKEKIRGLGGDPEKVMAGWNLISVFNDNISPIKALKYNEAI